MQQDVILRESPQHPAPGPQAGFTQSELQAAARVIENEVQRVTARYAREHAEPAARPGVDVADPVPKSARVSP